MSNWILGEKIEVLNNGREKERVIISRCRSRRSPLVKHFQSTWNGKIRGCNFFSLTLSSFGWSSPVVIRDDCFFDVVFSFVVLESIWNDRSFRLFSSREKTSSYMEFLRRGIGPPLSRSFSNFVDVEKKIRMKCSSETRWKLVSDGQKFSSFDILCCPSGNYWRKIFIIDKFVFPCRDHLHGFADLLSERKQFGEDVHLESVMKICPSFRVPIWRMNVSFINQEDFPSIEMKMSKRIQSHSSRSDRH